MVMLAAGAVRLVGNKDIVHERVYFHARAGGDDEAVVRRDVRDEDEAHVQLVLEVFLDVPPGRYRMTAAKFSYAYLGDRLETDRTLNYLSFVGDCVTHARRAVLNRGAAALRRDPNRIFKYPNRHAFEEEQVWLLWRHFGSGRRDGA